MPSYNNQTLFDAINHGDVKAVANLVNSDEFFLHSHKDDEGNGPYHYASNIVDTKVRHAIVSTLMQAGVAFQANDKNQMPSRHGEFIYFKSKQKPLFMGNLSNLLLIHPKDDFKFVIALVMCSFAGALFGFSAFFTVAAITLFRLGVGAVQWGIDTQKLEHRTIQQFEADLLRDIDNNLLTSPKLAEYIEQGVNIRQISVASNYSALEYAVKRGVLAQVQLLHPYLANTDFARSALLAAIRHDQQAIFDFLVSQTDNVDFDSSYTPLVEAVDQGRTAMVRTLLAKGAEPLLRPFFSSSFDDASPEIKRLLENARNNPVAKGAKTKATKEAAKPKAPVTPIFEAKRKEAAKQQDKAQDKPAAKAKAAQKFVADGPATRKKLSRACKK